MKKISNLLLSIILLWGAASCTDLLDPSLRNGGVQQIPEDAKVTLYFGTPAELSTKADMASEPTIESMHVFVFNKEGLLVETAEADKFGKVTDNGPAHSQHWSVTLTMAGEERRLHFIANLPKKDGKYLIPEAGSEATVFQNLASTYPEASYWQRRVLNLGIKAYQYDGSGTYEYVDDNGVFQKNVSVTTGTINPDGSYTDSNGFIVNKDDYIDRNACKIVTGTGFYAVSEVVEKIPMVRNFARIRVKSTWSRTVNGSPQTFTLTQAALVNKPAAGFVAAYDNVAGAFVPEYIGLSGDATPDVDNLSSYSINLPGAGIDKSEPTAFTTAKDSDGYLVLFSYERSRPSADPLCLLVAGKWNNTGNDIWYKIELTDQDGAYFPIYRDFTYNVDITGIEGDEGHGSASAAFKASAVADISNSPETATLDQISDDKGLTLWVSYIDKAVIDADIPAEESADGRYVTLLYTCYRQKGNNTLYFNDLISFKRQKHPDYETLPYATFDEEAITLKQQVQASDGVTVPDASLTWYIAKVKLNKIAEGQGYLRSQIHVEANVPASRNKFNDETAGYDKTLSRNVTYTVMPKQDMTLSTNGISDDSPGQEVTLTITLPTILTPSFFPLTLAIEAENNCLTPVDNLTVGTGKSVFSTTTTSRNSFYFLKTISYNEYYDQATKQVKNTFTCRFKTTKDSGNVPTNIRVTDDRKYFNLAGVALAATASTGGTLTNP